MKKLMIGFISLMLVMVVSANEKDTKKSGDSDNTATVVLSGTVSDSGSGELLAGVEMKIEGTGIKTYTDFDGKFSFGNMKPGEYKLVANYISYKKRVETLTLDGSENTVKIKLENPN
jgi:protocatechuate 3,4-dioxygenase beta subunit